MLDEVTNIQHQSVQMTERVEKGKEDVKQTLTKLDGVAKLIEGTKSLTNELTDSSRKSEKSSMRFVAFQIKQTFYR